MAPSLRLRRVAGLSPLTLECRHSLLQFLGPIPDRQCGQEEAQEEVSVAVSWPTATSLVFGPFGKFVHDSTSRKKS